MSLVPTGGRPSGSVSSKGTALITRSDVPPGTPYRECRQRLRRDFRYRCAYCGMTECEAQGIRMTIDHYEPRKVRPELENDYANLMYACDECNLRKGDRSLPEPARADGFRFFRPDEDIDDDHFEEKGIRLVHKSNTGYYSVTALDLNRQSLRRLRELRERADKSQSLVRESMSKLLRFRIDQLPPILRARALRAIQNAAVTEEEISLRLNDLISEDARSPMLDPDVEADERGQIRTAGLKALQAKYRGNWRGPRRDASS
ncbi:MAG: HNH endonuclease signature motif containing protein [Acidobacteriaceae bacterium]